MAPLAPIASRNFAAPAASGAPAQGNQLCGKLAPVTDSQANYKNLLAYGLARGVTFGLLVFAVTPVAFTVPAHADSISVDLDTTNVVLQRSGNLYKHNSSVHVHNSNDYGFTLNLDTYQPDLVNNRDSTYKINSVTGYYKYLSANQWGYGMGSDATSFNPVSNATLADVTKDNNGDCYNISNCTIKLTFGANIDPKRLPTGSYSTSLTYIVTSKPAPYVPPTPPAPYIPPEPPKPKYTTNGCSSYVNNCNIPSLHSSDTYSDFFAPVKLNSKGELEVSSSAASSMEYYEYSYSSAKWAFFTTGFRHVSPYHYPEKGDILNSDFEVYAFVPKFVVNGKEIHFCPLSTKDDLCKGASSVFSGYKVWGFWIDLPSIGCNKYGVSGFRMHVSDFDNSYEAQRLAKILIDAFGSPCPK